MSYQAPISEKSDSKKEKKFSAPSPHSKRDINVPSFHPSLPVSLSTLYKYIHTHTCLFDFDALAQGNAHKPTKELINYRGPSWDWTHYLQTEATPSAPVHFMPLKLCLKTQFQWHARYCTGQLTTQVPISTPVCVSFELCPGSGDIHSCWFNFDDLVQGNACKPTKEPINYRGPSGDRTHDLMTVATLPAASCPAQTNKQNKQACRCMHTYTHT